MLIVHCILKLTLSGHGEGSAIEFIYPTCGPRWVNNRQIQQLFINGPETYGARDGSDTIEMQGNQQIFFNLSKMIEVHHLSQ